MSWDETRTKRPCFCGKGSIVRVNRSDDWGRSESNEIMECPDCAARYTYKLVSPYERERMRSDGMAWVLKEGASTPAPKTSPPKGE